MSGAVSVFKKTFKYLFLFILVFLLLLFSLIVYVLYTESGTRFAVEQGIKYTKLDVSYDSLSGNISDGLIVKNFSYQSESIGIKVKYISYSSDWLWLSRHLILDDAQLDAVEINLRPSEEKSAETVPFNGFNMPLTVDVQNLTINEISLINNNEQSIEDGDSESTNKFNQINLIQLKADIDSQSASIENLTVKAPEFNLSSSGEINYDKGLSYDLETQWKVDIKQQILNGSGPINGDLQHVNLSQTINYNSDQLKGVYQLNGSVSEFSKAPLFDLQLKSEQTEMMVNQQNILITQLRADLNGLLENYKINLSADVAGAKVVQSIEKSDANSEEISKQQAISYPDSKITIVATGNTQEITTQNAQLNTPEGSVDLSLNAQWQPSLKIVGEVKLLTFNPEQIVQNWPGFINGSFKLELKKQDQGIYIKTKNNQLSGELKGQPFELTGSANYATETLEADQLRLQLGENILVVNGQVKPQNVALSTEINWLDLSLLSENLSGEVKGAVELSGDYQAPNVKAQISVQKLKYNDQIIEKLNLNSEGQWNESLNSKINIEQAVLAGHHVDSINITQTGWIENHQIELKLDSDDITTQLKVSGKYNAAASSNDHVAWQGQLLSHELTVENDKTILLQEPISIKIGELISVDKGCWNGVEAGQLCIELNDVENNKNNYSGSISVDAFSLVPLQIFLPEKIEVKGQLHGGADFDLNNNALNVESNINLQNGEVFIYNARSAESEPVYQTDITNLKIDAKTNNNDISININSNLSDQSFIELTAQLSSINDQPLEVSSTFSGQFNNAELIKQLTEEISEIEGQVEFEGSIMGELTRPRIKLDLSQPKGFVILARLGTVVENLKLNVSTEDIKIPAYDINFSGENLADINQGNIKSSGVFSLQENEQWQYEGNITGDNFMLLNLAEAKFNISPDLTVQASDKSAVIKGDLAIDSGRVTVKQLPASTIKNSSDVVIHRPNTEEPSTYPIELNIKANIKQAIELDVIGLKSGLTGSVQLVQNKNQVLTAKGILNLTDGTYEIYGQELTIKNGELTFTGPLDNPRINVKASRKSLSGDVTAGVELGGTVNNLRSTLYSDPSLSDIEKLSYIMTGRGIENSGGIDGEQLQQAAIVMGLNQSSPIFKQIQSQFGIDVLTVREAASTADTVVEAGKKLGEKLYVSYNQGLFNRLGFWLLKYRINEFLNLETTQGEDQSVELVYTRKAVVDTGK